MKLWEDSRRAEAELLIAWLLRRRNPGGGWPVDGVTEFALRELGCLARPTLSDGTVMRTLDTLHASGGASSDGFERAYKVVIDGDQRKRPRTKIKWTFFWPLRITLHDSIPEPVRLVVLGVRFHFVPVSAVVGRLGRKTLRPDSLRRLLHTVDDVSLPRAFLLASHDSPAWEDAWKGLSPAFDALRGLIEYGLGFGRTRWFFGEPAPRARLLHPEWMLIKSPKRPVEGVRFATDPAGSRSDLSLDHRQLSVIRHLAQQFRREPPRGSTVSLIVDALRLYAQAMDERHAYACFLGLWQLAESITLAGEAGGRTEEVQSRLMWHGGRSRLAGSGVKHLLVVLAQKRNDIVHRGIRDVVDDDDVNFMKRICETALLWLIRGLRNLPTKQHLHAFYQLHTSSTSTVEAYATTARFITRSRGQSPPTMPRG